MLTTSTRVLIEFLVILAACESFSLSTLGFGYKHSVGGSQKKVVPWVARRIFHVVTTNAELLGIQWWALIANVGL